MKHYLETAYELKSLIEKDERIINLNIIEEAMENNEEVMALTYNKDLKETYLSDALRRHPKDSIEVRSARIALFHAIEKVNEHELVKQYLEAYQKVEKIYQEINNTLFSDFKGATHACSRR